ncbi:DUF721 domain-containing protein [Paracoccus sp. 1_MG-2023]|uniref:DUF721 domain-containing protein n=1 Tax=unclassified Paracoccus (in: a-proteobacteria) TaxID=2688777 RepID=UPI001C0866F2|nr:MULTISPECIES: DUF721 domain-containing protein [unclassified Paracoccus (in: a-proteobacteria)]MBU2956918.1 DUF721 domain-containing protein [Paracoccus sp. C2R09]MDO6668116.1 DUF721 domain-containing protein [Paracoccus sp. 1_MG-2023]
MSQSSDSMKAGPRRRSRGFQAASLLLSHRVQKAAEGRGFAVSRLLTNWPEIAGPQLAAVTRPVRISHSRGGFGATLTLLTTGPMAPMVEMQLPQLRERVNACYGYNAVQRISLTQTAATGFAEGQASFSGMPAKPAPQPTPEAERAASRAARGFEDPTLAAAIQQLALNIAKRKT